MRIALVGLALATLSGPAAAGDALDPKLLVGTWAYQGSTKDKGPDRIILSYTADGKVSGEARLGADPVKVEGTYTVDGDKIRMKLRAGDKAIGSLVTVTKLTDTEMVASDEGQPPRTYKKVADKR